jgi:hypothetical protein
MAIFLIYDHNNTNPDPVKDQRGCYKRGDIVDVFEDSKRVTIPVQPPFAVIKVAGPTREQALKYIAAHTEMRTCTRCSGTGVLLALPEFGVPERECNTCLGTGMAEVFLTRRRFRLRWDDLPQVVKNELIATRYYETTWAAVKSYVRDKVTGLDEG